MKRLRKLAAITIRDITSKCDEILHFILNNCKENYIYFYVHDCLSNDRTFWELCKIINDKITEDTNMKELEQIIKISIIEIAKKRTTIKIWIGIKESI